MPGKAGCSQILKTAKKPRSEDEEDHESEQTSRENKLWQRVGSQNFFRTQIQTQSARYTEHQPGNRLAKVICSVCLRQRKSTTEVMNAS
jgi:hypothetical protein